LEKFVGKIGDTSVVALGDALVSAEYRYGTGIENGVAGAYMLTRSLNFDDARITVDENAWRKQQIDIPRYRGGNVDAVVGAHKKRICDDYASKKRSLVQAKQDAYMQFRASPLEISDFDKVLFANPSKEEGDNLKERGDANFKKSNWDASISSYLKVIELYEFCIKNSSEPRETREARDKQIRTLSNLGRAFEKIGNMDEAIDCFEKGIYLASNCEISDMLSLDKIPKFLRIVANNKLLSFGENHLEKKEFLERLIECLSRTKCDTTPYVQLLEETEKTIDNVEKIKGFKKGVKEIKPNFDADGLDEDDSISKDTTSSTRGSII
jgi:tetratricopeptide (TPR) repeat protein